ncbi:uncharacterized protein SOCE26_083660 [Sorangium cellulosum]|uniref:Uncharacterized protein n=1 Tax=Sorangium cellulosum TaxID=56 RepID=A0A2L0F5Q8_SORCE|nr:hypothetical protein [Sorangium cellulosum]AUX46857.1 uncharacterized protein SOCE26_083660 [Sorangium cellulosum]
MATQHPLAAFSIYLSGRHEVLLSIAKEITERLDACASSEGGSSHEARTRASDLMWLWTLGAYEVVRTMCQAQRCFSGRFYRAISSLKVDLERVRVPNTKLERVKYDRRQRSIPVASDRGPDVWDEAGKDLLVGDPADAVSARMLLRSYESVMSSLTLEDVTMSHEDSFERK